MENTVSEIIHLIRELENTNISNSNRLIYNINLVSSLFV